MPNDDEQLQARLGRKFNNSALLDRALTHSSAVPELRAAGANEPEPVDNEQLEFLGDAILGFAVSESLVRRFASFPEGRLSKVKAHLVSATRLHEVAQDLNLGAV